MALDDEPQYPPRDSVEMQFALALSATALAFAKTLRELDHDDDPLVTLQRNLQIGQSMLRRTPGTELVAQPIFRVVRDTLRTPDIIEQPNN